MTLGARPSKLESTASPEEEHRVWQRVIGRSKEECEAQRRTLIDAGEAVKSDDFVFRIIVSPKEQHAHPKQAT
jgi:hypothetical protein